METIRSILIILNLFATFSQNHLLDFKDAVYQVTYDAVLNSTLCLDENTCLSESCQVDGYYLNLILSWKAENNFTADFSPDCEGMGVNNPLGDHHECLDVYDLTNGDFTTTELPVSASEIQSANYTWEAIQQQLGEIIASLSPEELTFQMDLGEFKGPVGPNGETANIFGDLADSETDEEVTFWSPPPQTRTTLPENFSLADHPECGQLISAVRNQGSGCNSCWAFVATGVVQDSACLESNGAFNKLLSPTHLGACCTNDALGNAGCSGNMCTSG